MAHLASSKFNLHLIQKFLWKKNTKKIGGYFLYFVCFPNFVEKRNWKIILIPNPNSPEPNLRWTSDESVNSSLSVAVQEKKTRALYLSLLKRGSPMKFENTFFHIAKLRFLWIFIKIPEFSKNSQGMSLKARGLQFWNLAHHIRI